MALISVYPCSLDGSQFRVPSRSSVLGQSHYSSVKCAFRSKGDENCRVSPSLSSQWGDDVFEIQLNALWLYWFRAFISFVLGSLGKSLATCLILISVGQNDTLKMEDGAITITNQHTLWCLLVNYSCCFLGTLLNCLMYFVVVTNYDWRQKDGFRPFPFSLTTIH